MSSVEASPRCSVWQLPSSSRGVAATTTTVVVMNFRQLLGLAVLCVMLVSTTGSASASSSARVADRARDLDVGASTSASAKSDKPWANRYLYRARFDAVVKHSLNNDYGSYDAETREMSTRVTGTLPNVITEGPGLESIWPKGHRSTVKTSESRADTTQTTDDKNFVQTCTGSNAIASGRPYMVSTFLDAEITLFAGLEFPTRCTDNQGTGIAEGRYFLGPLKATLYDVQAGKNGAERIVIKIFGDATNPPTGEPTPSLCPGYVEGETQSCAYTVAGTLTLDLIKDLGPGKPTKGSKGTTVTTKKAKVKVECPAKCSIKIELLPLRGGPTLTVERVSPKPSKLTEVTVPIPPKKRKAVIQSGGVQIQMKYTLASGLTYTESRTALL